jgi:hypothetical protein
MLGLDELFCVIESLVSMGLRIGGRMPLRYEIRIAAERSNMVNEGSELEENDYRMIEREYATPQYA